jgi:peptidoglycan/LPS O-acetylase OafA/YrhL
LIVETASSSPRLVPYRPDIDGLRAISVLAVILFHAEVPGFAGGYVGVDVFFVVSGYLITQVLMAPSERGLAAQIGHFYIRRCRRILPALGVMLVVSALFACWLFLPGDLARFGLQLGFAAAFIGNWGAWRNIGYFDLDTPFAPLLHLWSLAVEEQFYLVFPVVFLVTGRYVKDRRFALFATAALMSFAFCVWASYYHPRANFFLAPTRAWELLLGALVALGAGHWLSTHPARDAFAGAALLSIVGCVLWYDADMRYPGLYAVVPCLSAAILLAAAGTSVSRVSRWMSAKPLVFTGLISYSLYLWHVPVLAFAGYYEVRPLEPPHLAALLVLVYALSAASWRYIETPPRRGDVLSTDFRFLATAGGATALVALVGIVMWHSQGLPARLSAADAQLLDFNGRLRQDANACRVRSLSDVAAGKFCRYGIEDAAEADVLVWGDSHAVVLVPAYDSIAAARNVRLHVAWFSACRPFIDAPVDDAQLAELLPTCKGFNHAMLSGIEALDPELIILNARWTYPSLDFETPAGKPAHGSAFQMALERTLRALEAHGRKVCVVGGVPTLEYVMPYAYAMARRRGLDTAFVALSRSDAQAQHRQLDLYFRELEKRHAFTFVDPKDALCRGPDECPVVAPDGRSVYRDDNHLTVVGAHLLSGSLEACFDAIG